MSYRVFRGWMEVCPESADSTAFQCPFLRFCLMIFHTFSCIKSCSIALPLVYSQCFLMWITPNDMLEWSFLIVVYGQFDVSFGTKVSDHTWHTHDMTDGQKLVAPRSRAVHELEHGPELFTTPTQPLPPSVNFNANDMWVKEAHSYCVGMIWSHQCCSIVMEWWSVGIVKSRIRAIRVRCVSVWDWFENPKEQLGWTERIM